MISIISNKEKFIYKQGLKPVMDRKLIKQGSGGYTIYLPKKWATKKGLKGGDNISITETDTSLVIGSPIKEKKEITIEITEENKKEVRNILTHAYRRGFDSIKFTDADPKIVLEIKKRCSFRI
jgi:phosphate uptake regulator